MEGKAEDSGEHALVGGALRGMRYGLGPRHEDSTLETEKSGPLPYAEDRKRRSLILIDGGGKFH